jgi:NADPH2:quinone reductase
MADLGASQVLINGASGAVGLAAVQMATATGCFVVGTAGTAAGHAVVTASGADFVANHREEGYLDQAKAALG